MIELKTKEKAYSLRLPTNLGEIKASDLIDITSNIKLPNNYCIVAMACNVKLFDFAAAINGKTNTSMSVTPIMAKISDDDAKEINSNIGDIIIIDKSSLERGVHININCGISSNVVRNYIKSDQNMIKDILKNRYDSYVIDSDDDHDNMIVLEFKICPITDVSASIDNNIKVKDNYKRY